MPMAAVSKAPQGAIAALLKTLRKPQIEPNPLAVLAGEKLSSKAPTPTALKIPEGFELPSGPSGFPKRSPQVNEQYARQRVFNAANRLMPKLPEKPNAFRRKLGTGITSKPALQPSVRGLEDLGNVAHTTPKKTAPAILQSFGKTRSQTAKTMAAKIDEAAVREIRTAHAQGTSLEELAKAYPAIKIQALEDVVKRRSWNWVK